MFRKKKKITCVFPHALVTCTHAAVVLCSHKRSVTPLFGPKTLNYTVIGHKKFVLGEIGMILKVSLQGVQNSRECLKIRLELAEKSPKSSRANELMRLTPGASFVVRAWDRQCLGFGTSRSSWSGACTAAMD